MDRVVFNALVKNAPLAPNFLRYNAREHRLAPSAIRLPSSSGEADPPYVSQLLRRLLRAAHSVIDFQPLECRRLCRIESKFFAFLCEEIALFRMAIKTAGLHLFGPAFDFLRRFLLAACTEPFDHLLVACALLDLGFEIVARYAM